MSGRNEVIEQIKRNADEIRARGVLSVYLFGSLARGEDHAESDIDLFVEYDPQSKFSLIDLVGVQLIVQDATGRNADVTTRNALHPLMREKIMADAVRVF